MNSYLLIPTIEAVFSLVLLAVVLVNGRRHIARRPFIIFLIFMGFWGYFIFRMRAAADLTEALFWEKFVFVSILSAAFFFHRFTLSLTESKQKKLELYVIMLLYLSFVCLIPTGLVVTGMKMMWYGKAPVIGPLFFPYVLCVYVPVILGLRVLVKHRKLTRINDESVRAQYIIYGIIAMFIGGTTDYLPSLGLSIYPLGIFGNILFCVLATVAMLRHGLLDIRVVLRKGAAYSLVSMGILGVFGSLIFVLSGVFRQGASPLSLGITITVVFAMAALFQPVLSRLQRVVDRWFLRERYDHLQALKRFACQTENVTDLKQLTSSFATAVANGMQSQSVYLLLPSASGDYVVYSYYGPESRELAFPAGSPLALAMKYQDVLVDKDDIDVIPSLSSLAESDRQLLATNQVELIVPLKNKEQLVGMLMLGHRISRETYSGEDRQLLQKTANELAANLENSYRYDSMQREHNELQKAMEGVVYAVSLVVETRDPYTAGHQRRVAELSCAIAREMGLSTWDNKGIRIAGLLHDVGKIVVPAEILSKPGPISQYEFSIIKTHPKVGYEILKKIEFPWPVIKTILQHHERLNGSGYPDGISGDALIMEARILGVADVVEAMSSHRPYRPALGIDAALDEIARARNTLYDPQVVDACINLFRRRSFQFEPQAQAQATAPAKSWVQKSLEKVNPLK